METDKKDILNLYIYLKEMSMTEDEKKLNRSEDKFRSLFSRQEKKVQLYIPDKDDFLMIRESVSKDIQLPDNGNSLLLYAMSIPQRKGTNKRKSLQKLVSFLIDECPDMIVLPNNSKDLKGITPLHVAVLKGDKKTIEMMTKKLDETCEEEKKVKTKSCIAEGPAFYKTAMMAGTLLGVATLKFAKDTFLDVLEKFPWELDKSNSKGDNILHSLIKYAHVQPDKKEQALDMLKYIIDCKFSGKEDKTKNSEVVSKMLMTKNKEKLTPLQVAAKREQFDFFKSIMQHEVYHSEQTGKGSYTEAEYDITEIETLPVNIDDESIADDEDIKDEYHESVLEYIVHHQTNTAFQFADFVPVREVIKTKWRCYKWWFWGWLVLHFAFMIFLSVTALYRSILSETTFVNNTVKFEYLVTENIPLTVASVLGLILGISHITLELAILKLNRFQYRTSLNWLKRIKGHFRTQYSNFMFRVYFLLFYFLLLVDFVMGIVGQGLYPDYNNSCLIFAVIIGWYLVMFFLQGFKSLSFFTVLIQKVIVDMLKFGFVMLIFLVAFSVAMQGADTEEDDFNNFGKTMVKMLTIMLGIGDLGILFKARQPILAISVFVAFVCLTTILLLNALIALMSNSCTDLMSSYRGIVATKYHCRLQRLSVILYLESCLPRRFCKAVGFKDKTDTGVHRWFWSLSSVQKYIDDVSETSVSSLNNADQSFSRRNFNKRGPKNKKISPNTKNEMPMTNTFTGLQPTTRYVEITNIDRNICKKCNTETMSESQAEQILEIENNEI